MINALAPDEDVVTVAWAVVFAPEDSASNDVSVVSLAERLIPIPAATKAPKPSEEVLVLAVESFEELETPAFPDVPGLKFVVVLLHSVPFISALPTELQINNANTSKSARILDPLYAILWHGTKGAVSSEVHEARRGH